ncbi:phage tail tape measure protein [Tepidibacillus sp. LV47]|uniref:phage tail tape measure protein n=1 Tax=Tepidibacillus sp. LV47 TaxID=3398228 RepID=UPI003AABC827
MANEEIGKLNVVVNLDSTGFQNGISNLNRQMKLVQSEFQAATAKLGQFGNSTDTLKLKADALSKQVELQKQKVAALEAAYQKSVETKGADAKATQDLAIKLNKAQAELAKMENELKQTTTEIDKQSSAWYKLSEKAKEAGEKMKSIGEKMSKVGESLSLYVTSPIMGVATAATKMAMDAVESENLFEVSMGKMAGAARQWSEDVSKSLGLNAFEVRKNVATYNAMLTSMGLTEKAAFDMSKGLTQLAYDMASFYNLKPEEAFEKLKAGISGETEPLKALGILVNDNTVKTYAYTHGIAKQGQELTEQQKVMARYGLIMDQTSKAQGDLARTIDSPTNQLRIMKQQVVQIGIQLGQILIPILQKVIATIKPLIDKFASLSKEKQQLIVKIGLVVAAIGPLLVFIGKLITAVSSIIKVFSTAGRIIALLTSPFGVASAAIIGLIAVGVLLYKNWDTIKAKAVEIKNNLITTFSNMKTKITDAWEGLKKKAGEIFTKIKDAILSPFKNLHIPLPHFSFKVNTKEIAGIKIPIPDVDVRWYATGGIFDRPSIIGVGEAGPEAVIPIKKLEDILAKAIKKVGGNGTTQIIFQGNYTFANEKDIDYFMSKAAQLVQRRKG